MEPLCELRSLCSPGPIPSAALSTALGAQGSRAQVRATSPGNAALKWGSQPGERILALSRLGCEPVPLKAGHVLLRGATAAPLDDPSHHCHGSLSTWSRRSRHWS